MSHIQITTAVAKFNMYHTVIKDNITSKYFTSLLVYFILQIILSIHTVNQKKGGSIFVIITLENLDRFL